MREEHEALDELLFFRRHFQFAQGLFFFKRIFGAQKQRLLALQFAGAALLQVLFHALEAFFDLGEIADHQVEFDVLDVAQRIDGADVRNGVVFKGAEDVDQRVDVAQAGEEGGLLEGFLADGGDVDVFDGGVGGLLGRVEGRELVEAFVGNLARRRCGLRADWSSLVFELCLGEDLE